MNRREWQSYVTITRDLPEDGKVTGPLVYAFTSGDHVSINTDAHINDHKPAVVFRGEDFLVHVHAYLQPDGTWSLQRVDGERPTPPDVTRRSNWTDAPPSFRQKIADAIVASVADIATPEVLARSAYAEAYNHETRALEEEAAADQAFTNARLTRREATKRRAKAEEGLAK